MIVWALSFNIAYRDGTTSILEITRGEKVVDLRKSDNVTWSKCKRLPKFVNFINNLGGNLSPSLPADVADYNFRFTATTADGHIRVLGGSDVLENQSTSNVDLATMYAYLRSDRKFASYFMSCTVLINTDYVDYQPGQSGAEASNLIDSLNALGMSVSTFTAITSAGFVEALSSSNMLFIPEIEEGYLILDSAAKNVIKQWVDGGGTLFVFSEVDDLIDDIFDLSITQSGEGHGTATKTAAAVGTPLENGPAEIGENNATSSVDAASLPPGSKSYYETQGAQSYVASIPYGQGQIIFMGWDWYHPSAGDPRWLTVLELLTQ